MTLETSQNSISRWLYTEQFDSVGLENQLGVQVAAASNLKKAMAIERLKKVINVIKKRQKDHNGCFRGKGVN